MPSVSDHRRHRLQALQKLAIDLGRREFQERYPDLHLTPVVVLICAYEEEDNLGTVLKGVPTEACGLPVTPVVMVDGGEDGTARVAQEGGAVTFVFPVNLGHGVALRVGYDLCVSAGARYVVTLDADGQNDPGEIGTMLQPLIDDTADFVLASRRLGVDETGDRYRQVGVVLFAALMNLLVGTRLTDTSNGYRALRAAMLSDVVGRLEQDQYQTAELLITCITRGWRVTERPTVWHERLSGRSKKGRNVPYGFRYTAVLLKTWLRER
jgi:glycosyltransferase involved in cell wall biosynthesis